MGARSLVAVTIVLGGLGAPACLPTTGGGAQKKSDRLQLDPGLCSSVQVPRDVSLASASAETRAALIEASARGAVAVRYVRSGCQVEFEIIPSCTFQGEYEYVPLDRRAEHELIRTDRHLLEMLPINAPELGRRLGGSRAIVYDRETAGELRIPARKPIRREQLEQAKCEGATHLVTGIELGRFWLAAGTSDLLLGIATPPKVRPRQDPKSGIEWLALEGQAEACEEARATARRRTGCDLPVGVSLLSIAAFRASEEPPSDDMLRIEGGSFERGTNTGAKDQGPARMIELDELEIDRTEVTASAYEICVARGACKAAKEGPLCTAGVLGKEQHPINCVDFRQAEAYCHFVNKRLPTEAEWEHAARRGDGRLYEWGSDWPPPRGAGNYADASVLQVTPYWRVIEGYDDGYAGTAPVGELAERGALAHMGGNVAEWVADIYADDYYAKGPAKNPTGPTRGQARVVRGASFGVWKQAEIALTYRGFMVPDRPSMHIGFRCARTPPADADAVPAGEDE